MNEKKKTYLRFLIPGLILSGLTLLMSTTLNLDNDEVLTVLFILGGVSLILVLAAVWCAMGIGESARGLIVRLMSFRFMMVSGLLLQVLLAVAPYVLGQQMRSSEVCHHICSIARIVGTALVFLSAAKVMRTKGAGTGLLMASLMYLYYSICIVICFWEGRVPDGLLSSCIRETAWVSSVLVPLLIPKCVLRNVWLVVMKWGWVVLALGGVVGNYVSHCIKGAEINYDAWRNYFVAHHWIYTVVMLAFWVLFIVDVNRNGSDFKGKCAYSFEGRMSRGQFWPLYIGMIVFSCVLAKVYSLGMPSNGEDVLYWLGQIFAYMATFFSIPLRVRRLHDRGMSGKWLILFDIGLIAVMVWCICGIAGVGLTASSAFLIVASIIGFGAKFVEFIMLCLKGTAGDNRFGSDPLIQ